MLAGYFLSHYSSRFNKHLTGFDVSAMDAVLGYDWPGNVRELQNAVQRAVSLAEDELVTFQDIFPSWTTASGAELPDASGKKPETGAGAGSGEGDLDPGFDLESTLETVEAGFIRRALDMSGGNLTQAAEILGITLRSIRYKVKKLKLDK